MSEQDTAQQLEAINANLSRQMSDYFLKVCYKSFAKSTFYFPWVGVGEAMTEEQLGHVRNCQARLAEASHLVVPAVYHGHDQQE